jgi:putative redox protein
MAVKTTWTKGMEFRVEYPGGETGYLNSVPKAERPGSGPSPMEAVLAALTGCTGMDVVSILQKMRKVPEAFRIEVESQRRDEHPRIYTDLVLTYYLDGPDLDAPSVARAVFLSQDKYCSVSGMLRPTVRLSYRIILNGKPVDTTPAAA